MKNLRKLAPHEIIRHTDTMLHGTTIPPFFVGDPCLGLDVFRKARTEGTPPGWRWDDGEEKYSHKLIDGKAVAISSDILLAGRSQQGSVLQRLQPYPEDPRLE